jgi:subtilisin family serine protease
MGKAKATRRIGGNLVEALEERRLLAWGAFPLLIDQDLAANSYPQYNGAGQTIVALDSGINFNHPALAGRIWTNPFEIPGNGIDDDNSGKIDDVNGWDFIGNDNSPIDDQGHGTMVAGLMAANRFTNTGNTRGYGGDSKEYQGIAPGAQVIPLRVANSTSYLDINRVQSALQWVIQNYRKFNIAAVNMSIGFGPTEYKVVEDELKTLYDGGVFLAASSGNGGDTHNYLSYPAASPYVAAVGALNMDDTINSTTSRGPSLDLLAPGNQVPYLSRGADYELGGAGTSYASPFAAAAGAVLKQVSSALTPAQILSILKDSGVGIYDSATGLWFKRLDLDSAIALAIARTGVTPLPIPSNPQTPFNTTPIALPGTLQFENFDNGGQNIAYYDATPARNDGGAYRQEGVDLQVCYDTGGGFHVSHARAGEWIEYTVKVGATGTYDMDVRVASYDVGGGFHIEMDGVDVSGSLGVPKTGGWNTWTTVSKPGISLTAGQHVLRLFMEKNNATNSVGNFNWIKFTLAATQISLPAQRKATDIIQAENYSAQNGVTKGSTNLSYVDGGDWVRYDGVDFGGGVGLFKVRIATADAYAGRTIELRFDSVDGPIIGKLTVQGTGGWGIFKEQTAAIQGLSGVHHLYLTFSGGGGVGNIDWFTFA